MPSFKSLSSPDLSTIKIPVANGESVTLRANLGRMSGQDILDISDATSEGEQYRMIAQVLANCVESWDVTRPLMVPDPAWVAPKELPADGIVPTAPMIEDPLGSEEPLPITPENIIPLPVSFVMEVFTEMQGAVNPPNGNGGSFGNG
jgi:hypothetical protein